MRDRLDAALAAGAAVPPLWVATVAAYFPLYELGAADALLAHVLARSDRRLARRGRCASRARRRRCATTIPQLTPIEDETSRAVRAQYEANPYPRWVSTAAPQRYRRARGTICARCCPRHRFRRIGKTGSLDILIAGCGTGQHADHDGAAVWGARTLAIDLSRASLAYAAARTARSGSTSNTRRPTSCGSARSGGRST